VTRKNRYDPEAEDIDAILENPEQWTRASRRAAGLRMHVDRGPARMQPPRYIRRNIKAFLPDAKRTHRNRRRIARIARAIKETWGTDAMLTGKD